MDPQGYDLVGDIHGHCDELIKLLERMGYRDSPTGYHHPSRKLIFLGDFIDRGEQLRQHRALLQLVMRMIDNGQALAVIGNHEFNALAFHSRHRGIPLRAHTAKNRNQHRAFLNEYESEPELKAEVLEFFYSLPLWLELDGLRVVHACWDQASIACIAGQAVDHRLNPALLIKASTKGTPEYAAVETLLKGVEAPLGEGIEFLDKDGHPRNAVRVQWWKQSATRLGEVALPVGVEIGAAAQLPIPAEIPRYPADAPPCFVGHYWFNGQPEPLAANVACLDYSVAKGGKLVAYRWSGEQILTPEHFVHN